MIQWPLQRLNFVLVPLHNDYGLGAVLLQHSTSQTHQLHNIMPPNQ